MCRPRFLIYFMTIFCFLFFSRRLSLLRHGSGSFSVVSVLEIVLPVFRRHVGYISTHAKYFSSRFDA